MSKKTSKTKSQSSKSKKKNGAAESAGKARQKVSASAEQVADRARHVGQRVSDIVQDAPEYLQAKRADRALRAEMDDHYKAIGKRVIALRKRVRGDESPFARFRAIEREADAYERVEEEYRSNRERMGKLRAEMRGRP